MIAVNPYLKKYKENQIETSTPEKILILLYDAAIQFLSKAKTGLESKNYEKMNSNILSCQKIIIEFIDTLDMENGGVLAQNLYRLYEYLYGALVDANLKRDIKKIDEVSGHLKNLKDTWQKAINISNSEKKQSLIEEDDEENDEYEESEGELV